MTTFIAAFIWGTIGFGIFIYGKKTKELAPFLVGLVLMIISYFLSAFWLNVAGFLLLGVLWMAIRGYF
jgi:hypothetical protein